MDVGIMERLFGELPLGLAIIGACACIALGVLVKRVTEGFDALTAEAKAGRIAVYEARDELRERILSAEKTNTEQHAKFLELLARISAKQQ